MWRVGPSASSTPATPPDRFWTRPTSARQVHSHFPACSPRASDHYVHCTRCTADHSVRAETQRHHPLGRGLSGKRHGRKQNVSCWTMRMEGRGGGAQLYELGGRRRNVLLMWGVPEEGRLGKEKGVVRARVMERRLAGGITDAYWCRWVSARKVLLDMGGEYSDVQLYSYHSTSKGAPLSRLI